MLGWLFVYKLGVKPSQGKDPLARCGCHRFNQSFASLPPFTLSSLERKAKCRYAHVTRTGGSPGPKILCIPSCHHHPYHQSSPYTSLYTQQWQVHDLSSPIIESTSRDGQRELQQGHCSSSQARFLLPWTPCMPQHLSHPPSGHKLNEQQKPVFAS